MKFQQIRSATIKISYGGRTFLIDPWLSKARIAGCLGIIPLICAINRGGDPRKKPIIDHCATWKAVTPKHKWTMVPRKPLPMSVDEVNEGVDAYICTHTHMDHIGLSPFGKACEGLNKSETILAQNKEDADFLEYSGMKDVRIVEDSISFGEAELIKVKAIHGTETPCGVACGYIFRSPNEKTLYVTGDTVWCDTVKETIEKYNPDVIITYNCAAMLEGYGRLIMDDNDLYEVYKAAPNATIIASHMDNVPHATLTRKTLYKKLKEKGIADKIRIPADGECYSL